MNLVSKNDAVVLAKFGDDCVVVETDHFTATAYLWNDRDGVHASVWLWNTSSAVTPGLVIPKGVAPQPDDDDIASESPRYQARSISALRAEQRSDHVLILDHVGAIALMKAHSGVGQSIFVVRETRAAGHFGSNQLDD
ncbi:MAG: hypothetical protein AAF830_06760 [Pseudomonadota bacterium]